MKRNLIVILLSISLLAIVSSCSVSKAVQMANCDYSFQKITGLSWAGLNFGTTSTEKSSMSLSSLAKCTKAISEKDFKTTIGIAISADNPGKREAAIAGFDYVLMYNDKEIASGESINRTDIVVPAHGSTTIPLNFTIDISKVVDFSSLKAIENTLHFLGEVKKLGDADTEFAIKLRPHIRIGDKVTKGPYIPIKSI